MLKKIKFKNCVVGFVILFVFVTFLGMQEILASSEPNIDRWHFAISEDEKAINLIDYWPYNTNENEDIIIPNGYDFHEYFYYRDPYWTCSVEKVFIDKELMSKIAKIASQNDINFRISDSDYSDSDFLVFPDDVYGSLCKVFASPGSWDDCFNFEDNNLKDINLSNLDTRYVTSMKGMFANCNNLTKLDLSNFITDRVVDMSNMFDGDNLKLKILNLSGSGFIVDDNVKTENMFSGLESQNVLILANDNNYERLSELASHISPLGLKFNLLGDAVFNDETQEKYMFDKAVFNISDGEFWRNWYESFDDYLEKILDIFFKQAESDIKDLNVNESQIHWNSEEAYNDIEEKFEGEYSASVKKILLEGQDYEWSQGLNELRYNGQEQNLVDGGFVSSDKKDTGVKIEYKLYEEDDWCDEVPKEKDCGSYRVYMRINGGEKYENIEYVDSIGRNYLRVKILSCKLDEGEDYKWPEAISNLKYDGNKQKLTSKGFIKRDKITDGVKFEYSKDGISWTDNILQESQVGHYKIYIRINGNGKYENVVYNSNGKKYIEVDIADNAVPEDEDDYDFIWKQIKI